MTLLFRFRNISVFAEHNPSLAELMNGHMEIIDDFGNINKAIVHRYVPDDPGRKEKQTYDYIKNKVEALQRKMVDWESKAMHFIQQPSVDFASNENLDPDDVKQLNSHIVHVITTLRSDVSIYKALVTSNYERLVGEAKSNRNFKIAIRSYLLAWVALIISLIALAISIWGI